MEIPEIKIRQLSIPDIPNYVINPSSSIPIVPPVTDQLGFPIVNIPGCVESNKENNPKNTALLIDDPRGTLTLCDGKIPSYNPIDFNAEDYLQTPKAPVPPVKPPKTDFKIPSDEISNVTKPQAPQVTTEEKEVILEEEPFDIIEYLPPAEAVVSTTVIAAAAATSALIARPVANFLLKIIKPVTKKIIKKISSKIGKVERVYSVQERREYQRELTEAVRAFKKLRGR